MTGTASRSPTAMSAGQVGVEQQDVAGLAVLADDPRPARPVGVDRAGQERLVAAAVQHRPRVVAHPAVDGDVRAHAGDRA